MKKTIFILLISILNISCTSTKVLVFENNLFDLNKNQVLFFAKKPNSNFEEIAIVKIDLVPKNEQNIYNLLKNEIKKNNFDAIVDIKSQVAASSFLITTVRYTGIGIKYLK